MVFIFFYICEALVIEIVVLFLFILYLNIESSICRKDILLIYLGENGVFLFFMWVV